MEDAHQYIKPETNLIEVWSAASTHNQEILEANSLFNTQTQNSEKSSLYLPKTKNEKFYTFIYFDELRKPMSRNEEFK